MSSKIPISKRTNREIKFFLNEILVPQMMLWGYKDGMTDKEIFDEIDSKLGKTLKERMRLLKSGEYDDWATWD